MTVPQSPKIYHIVHIDRLQSIINTGGLLCDKEVLNRQCCGTNIGLSNIKERRLTVNQLSSHPGLFVGECVPFYFCPRSIMLYVISRGNMEGLAFSGGQSNVIHLQSDLMRVIDWANANSIRWAFTTSNAGNSYYDDFADVSQLGRVDWDSVNATDWRDRTVKEGKQAEFLIESFFPWELVEYIGVYSTGVHRSVMSTIGKHQHLPLVEVKTPWYY